MFSSDRSKHYIKNVASKYLYEKVLFNKIQMGKIKNVPSSLCITNKKVLSTELFGNDDL